eukprot:COSAG02_NODE_2065_length_9961_cov_37.811397_7_plen_248_part_00
MGTDVQTCAMVKNETACNINTGRYRTCDWRTTAQEQKGPVCVNSAVDRLECYHQSTEASCNAAPGLPSPNNWGGQHVPLSRVWAAQLYNTGCSWESNASTCSAFTCESLTTAMACHLAANPKMPNMSNHKPGTPYPHVPRPKHCVWDKHKDGGTCMKTNPSQYCEMQLHPADPVPPHGPPMPQPPAQELCGTGKLAESVLSHLRCGTLPLATPQLFPQGPLLSMLRQCSMPCGWVGGRGLFVCRNGR